MTDTMLMKAARAILEEDTRNASERVRESMWARNPDLYISLAKAVLRAIREPSEACLDAGTDCDPGWHEGNADAKSHWHAMIDHILNSGEV